MTRRLLAIQAAKEEQSKQQLRELLEGSEEELTDLDSDVEVHNKEDHQELSEASDGDE